MEGRIATVKSGYGFVQRLDGQSDVFFYKHALSHDLVFSKQLMGRRVMFEVEDSVKGPQAVNVRPAERA